MNPAIEKALSNRSRKEDFHLLEEEVYKEKDSGLGISEHNWIARNLNKSRKPIKTYRGETYQIVHDENGIWAYSKDRKIYLGKDPDIAYNKLLSL